MLFWQGFWMFLCGFVVAFLLWVALTTREEYRKIRPGQIWAIVHRRNEIVNLVMVVGVIMPTKEVWILNREGEALYPDLESFRKCYRLVGRF